MVRQPRLFLTVGLPCTGKTTAARRIEIERKALRLTKDEWVKALYGHQNPSAAQDVIEGLLIQIGLRALDLGNNVVIDYGVWCRDERSALRQAAEDLDAIVDMRYFELTPAEQRRRLDLRQAKAPHTTWPMSDEELAKWAAYVDIPTPGELDGSEPIDGPPAGFATWDEWRAHRWPPSVFSRLAPARQDRQMASRHEYKVLELREKMIGGKMSGEKLEKILNEHGSQGWQLKSVTSADVKGRLGPGGVEGLLVTFERQIG